MNKKVIILISVLVLVILAGCFFWFVNNQERESDKVAINQKDNQENVIARDDKQDQKESDIEEIDTSNWQTYRNDEYGFEFKYPREWNKKENVSHINTKDGEYHVAVVSPERADDAMSAFYDEDVVIRSFDSIETKKKYTNDKKIENINNLDDYVHADFSITDFGCLYKTVELKNVKKVYLIEVGGNYGHYALMFDMHSKIFEIIFGRNKTFGDNCGNKNFELRDFLNKEEYAIISSFKLIE